MSETKHLIDVAKWIEHNHPLLFRADTTLKQWEHEVLIAKLLETPQSPSHHAEGPTLRSHLRLMLASLYAICDGQVRLTEIEEFARLRGLEDEILEMLQTITENPATFEVFCLVHDLGKQFRVATDAAGEVHYYGHEKEIYRAEVRELVGRLAQAFKLEDRDVEMLVPLVSYHMETPRVFSRGHEAKYVKLIETFATDQGQDADDFIDMLQACVLLDQVFGSRRGQAHGPAPTVDVMPLVNFFLAEREYAPWKLEQKEQARALERKRSLHKVLAGCGLDGHGIMALTKMKPGRELGDLLKKIQEGVLGNGEVAGIEGMWKDEVLKRMREAREKLAL